MPTSEGTVPSIKPKVPEQKRQRDDLDDLLNDLEGGEDDLDDMMKELDTIGATKPAKG